MITFVVVDKGILRLYQQLFFILQEYKSICRIYYKEVDYV